MTQREIQHLYLRAGFGADVSLINRSKGSSRKAVIEALFADSAHPVSLDVVKPYAGEDMQMTDRKDMTHDEKKLMREHERQQERKLNLTWLNKMMSGREMLNEKMTFFWHDHFACKDENATHAQALNNTIRKYALGDFRQMLQAVSKEPAMLKYLNNQQNKKNAPNENFAREVMELFTLGRGNYTEADIKNAARAFTGWGFDKETMKFQFREKQHDYGEKTFLGATGDFNGEEALRLITDQKQCARFITDKVYRYFVNEKGNAERVAGLADDFYTNGYDIAKLMQSIFSADWFYDQANIGVRIKSPVELMASLGRHFDPKYTHENILILVQRVLGQLLFNPPNVAGWPNGTEWIDSSSLIFRTNLGRKIIDSSEIDTVPKPDDDKNPNEILKKEKRFELIEARIDWEKMVKEFSAANDVELISKVGSYLLQMDVKKGIHAKVKLEGLSAEQKLKQICAELTSLPEYQLC